MSNDCGGMCVCGHMIRWHSAAGGSADGGCVSEGCTCGRYAPGLPTAAGGGGGGPVEHDARTCSLCVMYGAAGRAVRITRRGGAYSGGPDGRRCVRDGHRIGLYVGPYRAEYACAYCDYRESVRRHPERCDCEESWESRRPTGPVTGRCKSCWFWHKLSDLYADLCPGCRAHADGVKKKKKKKRVERR